MKIEITKPTQQIHNFCLNRKEVEEIRKKYNNFGFPNICYIAYRYEKYYLLVHLDSTDYYAYFCSKTPIEDILEIEQKEDEIFTQRLEPKVIKITKREITLSLRKKTIKLPIRDNYNY